MNDFERFRQAFKQAWMKKEAEQWVYGTAGRLNQDGTFTFVVPGRPTFIYVTLRHGDGAQTVVAARNDGSVPHMPLLPLRMKQEHGIYVIYGKSLNQTIADAPAPPPYGIDAHAPSHQHGGDDEVGTATPTANGLIKADADGKIGEGWIDDADIDHTLITNIGTNSHAQIDTHIAASIAHGTVGNVVGTSDAQTLTNKTLDSTNISTLTEKNPPVDADSIVSVDSEASNVFKRLTFTNLKAFLKTYFDTLYATTTGWVKADGTVPLTAEWDIGEDMAIRGERLEARDAEGLSLQDDGGNLGVAVADGGNVGIKYGSAIYNLHVVQPASNTGKGIMLGGDEYLSPGNAGNSPTAGILLLLSVSRTGGNRQLLIVPTDNIGDSTKPGFRFLADNTLGMALMGGGKGDGSGEMPLLLNANGETVFVGAGSTSDMAGVGGTLLVNTGDVGNVGGGEDDLITYSIPANTLSTNGDSIWFEAVFIFANNANNKTAKMYFGATELASVTSTGANLLVIFHGRIIRTGATTQEAYTMYQGNLGTPPSSSFSATPGSTLSGAVTIKGTGTSAASATNDVVMRSLVVGWHPANS